MDDGTELMPPAYRVPLRINMSGIFARRLYPKNFYHRIFHFSFGISAF